MNTHPHNFLPLYGEDVRETVRDALRQGVRVTPLCRAVMGWLSGAPTTPSVAEIRMAGDGWVWLRLSDESVGASLCPFTEFLSQVRVIGESLGLSEGQTETLVGWAQMRLF